MRLSVIVPDAPLQPIARMNRVMACSPRTPTVVSRIGFDGLDQGFRTPATARVTWIIGVSPPEMERSLTCVKPVFESVKEYWMVVSLFGLKTSLCLVQSVDAFVPVTQR